MSNETTSGFAGFGLPDSLLEALKKCGYEQPSPIQAAAIPELMLGRDLLGQAQTGTGKTAAFALPLLARINLEARHPQVLVLAPTRELAIQIQEHCLSSSNRSRSSTVLVVVTSLNHVNIDEK